MISQETKERIAQQADNIYIKMDEAARNIDEYDFDLPMFDQWPVKKLIVEALEAEATRAEGLVEFLVSLRKHPRVTNQMEEMITEALNNYNKTDK